MLLHVKGVLVAAHEEIYWVPLYAFSSEFQVKGRTILNFEVF